MVYKNTPKNDPDHEYADILGMLKSERFAALFHLKSKVYEDKIEWINYCFELKSKIISGKQVLANWIIYFQDDQGLGALPYYYFKDSDKSITDLDGLRSIPSKRS